MLTRPHERRTKVQMKSAERKRCSVKLSARCNAQCSHFSFALSRVLRFYFAVSFICFSSGPFVLALNKTWCPDHFICATPNCNRKLLDIGFVEENGLTHCEFCYEKYLAAHCSKCSRSILGVRIFGIYGKVIKICFFRTV